MKESGWVHSAKPLKLEVFMAIRIISANRFVKVICITIVLAFPVSSVNATDFGFSGMQIVGIDNLVAKALNLPKPEGVLVIDVVLGGPADMARIKRGDLITHFDDIKIDTFDRIINVVTKTRPGQKASIKVRRGGQDLKFTLELGSKPASWAVNKNEVLSFTKIGLTLASITQKIRKRFNIPWGTVGVLVTLIDPAVADIMLLRRGDVIVQVNQSDVWQPGQIKEHYDNAKAAGRSHLLMLVERIEGFHYMMLPVK